ncbi:MAG: hypothetical protein GY795_04800, partial [Desulfobacterales bacterium]|nr:hypothetical protein [Desulfobacterales bacterium]
ALGNTDQAIAYGEECVRLFQALESPWGVSTGYSTIQIARLVAGDYEASIETGHKILSVARNVPYPLIHGSVKAYIAEAMIHMNRIDEAETLLQEAEEHLRHTKIQDCHFSLLHGFIAEQKGDRNGAMDRARQSLAHVRNEGLSNHFISDRTWLVPCLVALYAGKEYRPEIESVLAAMGEKALYALSNMEHHGDNSYSVQTIRELIRCVPSHKAPGLKVCCLGQFRLFLGEKEIPADHWKSKKARTLLKLLIHYSPRGYTSKEVFIEYLWPGEDPDKTAKRFHVALSAIRKTLEPDIRRGVPSSYIKSDMDTYQLSVGESGTIDSLMFENLCRKSHSESDTAGRMPVLLQAADLYQGAYFGEDLYEDWCCEAREHLKTLYLNILTDLIAYYEEIKDYSNAIEFCQRYLKEDCYAERIYQKLMRFHALTSSTDQVRKTYFRCRDAIVSDLGCPLSRETDLLFQELIPENARQSKK